MQKVILPLRFKVRAGNVWVPSDLLVARHFFLNDIYVFSIKVNNKVSEKVDEMLDVLGVMMEGVVEVDKEVDEILMEKKWVKCSI